MYLISCYKIKDIYKSINDTLIKNSVFLILSSFTSAGSGFIFWIIAARFYSPEDVGVASAIIAAMGFISMLSMLGFDISLVRYLSERKDVGEVINTCFTVTFFVAIILSLIFIAGIEIWSPTLIIIKENLYFLLIFIIYTAISSIYELQKHGVFVGFRKAKYSFFQAIITIARVAILPFVVFEGSLGIYYIYGLTPVIASVFGFYIIGKTIKIRLLMSIVVLKIIISYSLVNYIARFFEMLPAFILPLLVVSMLGKQNNAYFYIAWQISFLLLQIPRFAYMSLLAEGVSKKEKFKNDKKRIAKLVFISQLILLCSLFLFGKTILMIFGESYANNSFNVLIILSIGSIPFSFNALYATEKRLEKKNMPIVFVYGGIAALTFFNSYVLVQSLGLSGIGFAWSVSNLVVAMTIVFCSVLLKHHQSG